jgi:GTP-sensing pleiotropic transcriptional regulator CodY
VSAIREPRAAKSFRAAADRIVRQETAMPSIVSRLLTPTIVAKRQIVTDSDEWAIRLAALAALGQYDGVTFVVEGQERANHAHNVAPDAVRDAAVQSAIDETRRTGATVQAQTAIRLADDRLASAAMVAPLVSTENVTGVLIALRVGRSFAAADALAASGVSDLVSLELARETLARRDEAHRRQAFALYELGRLALFGEHLLENLQDVTALLVSALEHDLAQIWLLDPEGALELTAARPSEKLRFEHMRPSEHDVLAEALHQRRLVRVGQGALRPWVGADTRDLMVIPLADRDRNLGVLVLGRGAGRYTDADEELAGVLGRFISRLIVRSQAREMPEVDAVVNEREPDREWEQEPQLSRS